MASALVAIMFAAASCGCNNEAANNACCTEAAVEAADSTACCTEAAPEAPAEAEAPAAE